MGLPDHLSASQINLYLQCPLKYKFQYIDRIPRAFKPSGLAFGGAVHSAISWFHRERMNGNGVTLERFYRIFQADWYSQKLGTEVRYRNGEDEGRLISLGKAILGLYFQNPVETASAVDVPFVIPLVHPGNGECLEVPFEGFFDLLEGDGTIVEFKTSGQAWSQKDADDHLQLTAYAYAYEALHHKPPKCLRLIDFVKTKTPRMLTLETRRGKADYEGFYALIEQVIKGIKAEVFFPRASYCCAYCEYEGQCTR